MKTILFLLVAAALMGCGFPEHHAEEKEPTVTLVPGDAETDRKLAGYLVMKLEDQEFKCEALIKDVAGTVKRYEIPQLCEDWPELVEGLFAATEGTDYAGIAVETDRRIQVDRARAFLEDRGYKVEEVEK